MRTRHLLATCMSAASLCLATTMPTASALVWTDQADYAPGSVVTISGDSTSGAQYLTGEAVAVSVSGPNGYAEACTGLANTLGAWSCQVTLWDNLNAVGPYTYVAVGATSGATETGDFTDASPFARTVTFSISATGLTTGTISLPIGMDFTPITGPATTETHTVATGAPYPLTVKKNNPVTYRGFMDTVTVGSYVCTRSSGAASGTINVADTDTAVAVSYTCGTAPTVDTTAPVISYELSGTLGLNGWYTSDVYIDWTVTDGESAVIIIDTGCVDETLTAETAGTTRTCTAHTDGGSSTKTTDAIKIDKTGPSATLAVTAGTLGAHGWYTDSVTVHLSGVDTVSAGVECDADQYLTSESKGTVFNGQCTNDAGLSTDATPLTIKLDMTGPSATLAAARAPDGTNGWYTDSVTISTNGTDSISSPVTCTADQYLDTESTGTVFYGSCTNDAGLTTSAETLTVKLDKTAPAITWSSATPVDSATYYWGDLPSTLTCTALDGISDITSAGCRVTGYGTETGTHTAVASATNGAGLVATETRTYTVLPWTIKGFYNPVSMAVAWNVVKAGSTVPLKFEVFKGTTEQTTKGQIVSGNTDGFTLLKNPTDGPPPLLQNFVSSDLLTSGKTQLRYDGVSGQFIQNWQTPKTPGVYYKVTLTTRDGSSISAWFLLK